MREVGGARALSVRAVEGKPLLSVRQTCGGKGAVCLNAHGWAATGQALEVGYSADRRFARVCARPCAYLLVEALLILLSVLTGGGEGGQPCNLVGGVLHARRAPLQAREVGALLGELMAAPDRVLLHGEHLPWFIGSGGTVDQYEWGMIDVWEG